MYISLKIVFRFPCAPNFCRHIQGPIWGWFFFMLLIRFPKLFKERFHLKVFVYFIAHYKLILLFFFKFQRSNSNDVEEHKNCLRLKLHHLLLVQNSWCNFKCKLFLYSAIPHCKMLIKGNKFHSRFTQTKAQDESLQQMRSKYENPFQMDQFYLWNGLHISTIFQCCVLSMPSPTLLVSLESFHVVLGRISSNGIELNGKF